MIKIQSNDYRFMTISNSTSFSGSDPVVVANVDMSYDFKQKWELVVAMLQEWQEQQRLINSSPAIKASYEQFQQMCQLAKEAA